MLLLSWVSGAVLPDSNKETSEPAAESSSADSSSSSTNDDSQDARIGLYAQKAYDGYSFGPIGGNSAFFLTSLPGYDGKLFQWLENGTLESHFESCNCSPNLFESLLTSLGSKVCRTCCLSYFKN